VERSLFLSAVDAALSLSASQDAAQTGLHFARRACTEWLARWPGDARVRGRLADACILAGEYDPAVQQLTQVIEADPESPRAYRTLSALLRKTGKGSLSAAIDGCLYGLGASTLSTAGLPDWADPLQSALRMLRAGRWQEARLAAETVLRAVGDHPLPALIHLQTLWRLGEHSTVLSAGREYRAVWPGCGAFLLLMAQSSFAAGRNADGVEFLHTASVADPAGEVADRYLGALNPYRSLWPAKMQAELSAALPPEVATAAGWNRLAAAPAAPEEPNLPEDIPVLKFPEYDSLNPEQSPMAGSDVIGPIPGEMFAGPASLPDEKRSEKNESPHEAFSRSMNGHDEPASAGTPPPDPELNDLRRQLHEVADRLRMRKSVFRKDARRPAYLILTSRKRLASIYGAGSLPAIDQCLQNILKGKRAASGWSAHLVDPEDGDNLKAFGLAAVDASNAWQVKTLLRAMDSALGKTGEQIGALLIVGGSEVIPFHLLPNPTDDDDADVPSDNPYATRDENYFVSEWPVGRIPTPSDPQAAFLVGALKRIADPQAPVRSTLLGRIFMMFSSFFLRGGTRFQTGSACTAAVWRKASLAVFQPVAGASSILTAPPTESDNLPAGFLDLPKYTYFNLHGLEHGAQWLGQRDAKAKAADSEFPVVLVPAQVAKAKKTPEIVFTEACYGANILHKGLGEAISLEFLAAGTRALAGSTKICYGAAAAPLIAADLLGRLFLQNCLSGIAAGEALRLAKLAFAEEMNRRQGFLDPEDQKTLISYILLGDPLYVSAPGTAQSGKGVPGRRRPPAQIKTLFAKDELLENGSAPSPKVQSELKAAMERYLPGMTESRMRYLHPRGSVPADGRRSGPGRNAPKTPAWVVALDRKSEAHGLSITQYAKISVDAAGHVVKIAVSR
jgi:hypothetical protein